MRKILTTKQPKLKVLTWHIHGSYLYYLTQVNAEFYLPIKPDGSGGKTPSFPWGDNVHEIPEEKVRDTDFDVIAFQSNFSPSNPDYDYLSDQTTLLSVKQLKDIPKIFIEHDPPREHPTDTKHILANREKYEFGKNTTIVHVTHFNDLMWDSGLTPTHVIDHGVTIPENVRYSGEIAKGIVVVNNLYKRGRRLGLDVFETVRKEIPLDLVGMGAEKLEGIGEIQPEKLPAFISHYRFFFNPIRYTSLGLSVLEAMMVGLPIIGLATTELTTIIHNGVNGFIDTNVRALIPKMKELIEDSELAHDMGKEARKTALARFSIDRFTQDWQDLFTKVTQNFNNSFTRQLHTYPAHSQNGVLL